MELSSHIFSISIATTFLFLLISTSSVFARPLMQSRHHAEGNAHHHSHGRAHVRPRITLADLDEDGAIPKNELADIDELAPMEEGLAPENPEAETVNGESDVHFDAVNLPSHFETYDKNHDKRVSLHELSMVTGTKEIDAEAPFRAADLDGDGKISFEEFKQAPWIFGVAQEIQNDAALQAQQK